MFLSGDVLRWAAVTFPSSLAASLGAQERSFGELDRAADRTAHALASLGVRRGDRVACWLSMSIRTLELRFGLARLGAAFAPLNPAFTVDEAAVALRYLHPRLTVLDAAQLELGCEVTHALDIPAAAVGLGDMPRRGVIDLDERTARAQAGPGRDWAPDDADIDTIYLTSGSTGRPKGVLISQRANWLRAFGGTTTTVTPGGSGEVCMFPLYHMAGWNFVQQSWSLGRPIHLVHRADPELLMRTVDRYRASVLYCIPAIWHRILESAADFDGSSLRWALTGTSQVSQDLLHCLKDRFPASRTTVSYGSTEAGQSVVLSDDELFTRPGAVGFPVPGTFARLSAAGELLLRSHWLMSGYFDLPHETADVLVDGWYRTGDLATMDADGALSIVGRTKETIRTGGEWVAPVEVEQVLLTVPGVREAAVVGVADDRWSEIVCAVLVLEDGVATPTVDDVRSLIGDRLAPHKHPRRIVRVDTLPRTPATGQIQRLALRAVARRPTTTRGSHE